MSEVLSHPGLTSYAVCEEIRALKLEVRLRPPEFMIVAFIGMCGGSEEITVRATTREALERFIDHTHLRTHPRLRSAVLTDASGTAEDLAEAWRVARRALV